MVGILRQVLKALQGGVEHVEQFINGCSSKPKWQLLGYLWAIGTGGHQQQAQAFSVLLSLFVCTTWELHLWILLQQTVLGT